jgi:hypothetical protein
VARIVSCFQEIAGIVSLLYSFLLCFFFLDLKIIYWLCPLTNSHFTDITADGVFSFGMMAEFENVIKQYGPHIYRYLFWEAGLLGQVMYLEAEAVGIRATGYVVIARISSIVLSFSLSLFLILIIQ